MHIRRPQDIGALVRSTRTAQDLNQQDLADRLGVSRWWVNELEGGKTTARMDLVLRCLNELGITLSAHSDDAAEVEPTSSDQGGLIDIDAIADTGLEQTPQKRKRRPQRRRK